MDVSVCHTGTGHSCVIGVQQDGTVLSLKEDALEEMFAGSVDADHEAAAVAAHVKGCEEELDDAQRIADTGLEDGGAVQLVPRLLQVKAPAVYSLRRGRYGGTIIKCITLSRCGGLCVVSYTGSSASAGYNYQEDEGRIVVFDTRTAAEVANFTRGKYHVLCTSFSVCGTWLATCSLGGTISVWLTATWEQVYNLVHNTGVYSAAWSCCGRLVSGDGKGNMRVWELEDPPSATVLEGHTEHISSIAVSGTRIFSGSRDKTIRVWDISTLTHTHTLDEHTQWVSGLTLTKDEQHLVSCSWDNSFKVWCTASLSCLRTVRLNDDPFSLAVSQPGDGVAVNTFSTSKVYHLSTGECLGRVASRGVGVALSPCGRWVFTPTNTTASVSVCAVASLSP